MRRRTKGDIRGGITAACAAESESAQLQRLGWLLDRLGQPLLADSVHDALPSSKPLSRILLDPGAPRIGTAAGNRWQILENAQPEADL